MGREESSNVGYEDRRAAGAMESGGVANLLLPMDAAPGGGGMATHA